jgi:hypothetical protein
MNFIKNGNENETDSWKFDYGWYGRWRVEELCPGIDEV